LRLRDALNDYIISFDCSGCENDFLRPRSDEISYLPPCDLYGGSRAPPETLVQRLRPVDICWSISVVSKDLRCARDREAGHHCSLASRGIQIVLALEVATSWWSPNGGAERQTALAGSWPERNGIGRLGGVRPSYRCAAQSIA
jgi:hypothetical protein